MSNYILLSTIPIDIIKQFVLLSTLYDSVIENKEDINEINIKNFTNILRNLIKQNNIKEYYLDNENDQELKLALAYFNWIDFKYVLNPKLVFEEFFEEHLHETNLYLLCNFDFVSEDFLYKHRNSITKYSMKSLCMNQNITEKFFKRVMDQLDHVHIDYLCCRKDISMEFFEELIKYKHMYQDFYQDFYIEKVCKTATDEEYIKKYTTIENLDTNYWYYLCSNNQLSDTFFEKYIHKLDYECWQRLYSNNNISEAFLEKYFGKINEQRKSHFSESYTHVCFLNLCGNNNISEEFFEKHFNEINYHNAWTYLCRNNNISEAFFEKYIKYFNFQCWDNICVNTNISEAFFEKHIDEINKYDCWNYLYKNSNISKAFFDRHNIEKKLQDSIDKGDKINWYDVYSYKHINRRFFSKNLFKMYKQFFVGSPDILIVDEDYIDG